MTVFAIQYFVLMTLGAVAFWRVPLAKLTSATTSAVARYRRQIVQSYVGELITAAVTIASGNVWLFIPGCLLLSAALTWYRVRLAARIVPSVEVRALAARLQRRHPRAHRRTPLEILLGIATFASIVLIVSSYKTNGSSGGWFIPATILYIYFGLLLARRCALDARLLPVPAERAEEYFALQEVIRRLAAIAIDWLRTLVASLLLCWSLLAAGVLSSASASQILALAFWIPYVMAMIDMSPRLWNFLILRASVCMPVEPIRVDQNVRVPLHWAPDSPTMLIQGPHGAALNVADRRTQMWLAYAAAFTAIIWIGVIA